MSLFNPDEQRPDEFATVGVQKIRTMIEGFDDISHGGLPVARSTLVSGTSPVLVTSKL